MYDIRSISLILLCVKIHNNNLLKNYFDKKVQFFKINYKNCYLEQLTINISIQLNDYITINCLFLTCMFFKDINSDRSFKKKKKKPC